MYFQFSSARATAQNIPEFLLAPCKSLSEFQMPILHPRRSIRSFFPVRLHEYFINRSDLSTENRPTMKAVVHKCGMKKAFSHTCPTRIRSAPVQGRLCTFWFYSITLPGNLHSQAKYKWIPRNADGYNSLIRGSRGPLVCPSGEYWARSSTIKDNNLRRNGCWIWKLRLDRELGVWWRRWY